MVNPIHWRAFHVQSDKNFVSDEYQFGSVKTYQKESQAPNIFTRGNNLNSAQKNFSLQNHPTQGIAKLTQRTKYTNSPLSKRTTSLHACQFMVSW